MLITRRVEFSASHVCRLAHLSDQENRELFGPAANPHGHGHNYVLEVSARGPLDGATGRAVDTALLDEMVARQVLDRFEHRNLNAEVEAFERLVPTSENLGVEICRSLKAHWKQIFPGEWPKLEKIRIAETPRNIFEIRADEIE